MHARWQRVRELFERALDAQPADLDAWLAREAPDDPEVREEVRSLLEHDSRAGRFLAMPVSDQYPTLLNEDDPFEPGHVIGPYTIVRELGHGGMGWVYLATDARLGRQVALKALAPQFVGDSAQKERLTREARTAANLNDPGICIVYELYKHDDGNLFIASEHIDGHTLRAEIERGPRPTPDDVLRTAREIASALAAAHVGGVFHRDLKPDNVMRTATGRIKILDFGLARHDVPEGETGAVMFVTQPGVLVGTPSYMAPEQVTNQRGDARSDVWAYGVLLYELASGAPPFKGATIPEVYARIVHDDPIPIRVLCPALPIELCSVIERCLKKWPAQRFASASEIGVALDPRPAFAPPAPIPVIPVPPSALPWWRAHQVVVIALYFLACVAAWFTKEGLGLAATVVFGIVTTAATVGGVLRGHLLFVERTNQRALAAERRRTDSVTWLTDTVMAMALVFDGILLSFTTRHVAAALSVALGIVILLARLRIEPSSAQEAFGSPAHP